MKILERFLSPAGKALKLALQTPENWTRDRGAGHTIFHTPTNTSWWISGTWANFNGYDKTPECLTLVDRLHLHKTIKNIGIPTKREQNQQVATKLYQSIVGGKE